VTLGRYAFDDATTVCGWLFGYDFELRRRLLVPNTQAWDEEQEASSFSIAEIVMGVEFNMK